MLSTPRLIDHNGGVKPTQPFADLRTDINIMALDGLVAFWDFATESFTCRVTGLELSAPTKPPAIIDAPGAPLGSHAIRLEAGQYLRLPREQCTHIDFHGDRSAFTLVSWINRGTSESGECEFIAGMWNETRMKRQYGLFLNNRIWGGEDKICAHVSATGGVSTGFRCCFDAAMGAGKIEGGRWTTVAMSFGGGEARAWQNGRLDGLSEVNPYRLAAPIFDGGPVGSEFTVGSVHHHGSMGNQFVGEIAGIAIFARELTPAEHLVLASP